MTRPIRGNRAGLEVDKQHIRDNRNEKSTQNLSGRIEMRNLRTTYPGQSGRVVETTLAIRISLSYLAAVNLMFVNTKYKY